MNPEATEPAAKPKRAKTWIVATLIFFLGLVLFLPFCNTVGWRSVAQGHVLSICAALRMYNFNYDNVPTGDNRAIIHVLQGDDRRKIICLDVPPKYLSPSGEFLDPWGTPYHIDVSDPKNPKVYSFGPNKRDDGGQGDDVVSWR